MWASKVFEEHTQILVAKKLENFPGLKCNAKNLYESIPDVIRAKIVIIARWKVFLKP